MYQKKKIPIMVIAILILQIAFPILSVTIESALTPKSIAYEYEVNNITWIYYEKNGTAINVEPKDKTGLPNEIIIPSELNGLEVKEINYYAFEACENITSVEIPNTVTYIGRYAFAGCTNLQNVKLSNSLEELGECAFLGCDSLTNVELPNSVVNINDSAFASCPNLKSIIIPENTKYIGENVFYNCTSLEEVRFLGDTYGIYSGAFKNCTNLSKIKLPVTLTYMGEEIFKNVQGPVYYYSNNNRITHYIEENNDNTTFVSLGELKLEEITIENPPNETEYSEGENFDKTGMIVKARYSDASEKNIENYIVTDGINLQSSKTSVEIAYMENSIIKKVTQQIAVTEDSKKLTNIRIADNSYKTNYLEGQIFNPSRLRIIADYDDGSTKEITNFDLINEKELIEGSKIKISYTEKGITKTVEQNITVNKRNRVLYKYI